MLTAAGALLLVLGGIGLVIPVWPTTPFVLAAAGCFTGNPRVHGYLMRCGLFREYLERYQNGTPVSRRTFVMSLSFLWGMLILSAVLLKTVWAATLMLAVGAAVTIHLWLMRK